MSETIPVKKLFKTKEALTFLPENIRVSAQLRPCPSDIDVIICGFGFPELTNATIKNYLSMEKSLQVHIIVVDSSGSLQDWNKIVTHARVSKILIHDFDAKHPTRGQGSL